MSCVACDRDLRSDHVDGINGGSDDHDDMETLTESVEINRLRICLVGNVPIFPTETAN